MITTSQFEIPRIKDITSTYIESELKKLGVSALRWAITEVKKETFSVSVSYEK